MSFRFTTSESASAEGFVSAGSAHSVLNDIEEGMSSLGIGPESRVESVYTSTYSNAYKVTITVERVQ